MSLMTLVLAATLQHASLQVGELQLKSLSTQSWAQSPSSDRPTELRTRISDLNAQIRAIDTNWPVHLLLLGYGAYVVGPVALVGGGAALAVALFTSRLASGIFIPLLAVGVVGLTVAALSVVAIVYAFTEGQRVVSENRRAREALIDERRQLEEELRRWQGATAAAPILVPSRLAIASF